ncbi:putative quinol monooxygenase [Sinisalibacter aestuarii]|uniref:Antibiotic biosynthesis monooxygenase n=1 Tax=Sinisalibacter aestuarii TaxID=2949426 RepID=A0ABQ5LRV3_9RHOB|nr:antibiotic biosynthesis monooxygenase [Sinisalibacter aestuarii]GKY87654.1 antibiotic biosynthesis monooxygenase [Sinisalibacter aestuarii]
MTHAAHIRLTGHIDVPEPRRAAIAAALPEHIRLTRAEPGCLAFEVRPDPAMPGRYTVAELFASRAAFEAHQARVAASDWGRISAGLPRSYTIDEVPA